MEELATYLRLSEAIPGWTRHAEAEALARTSLSLSHEAVIVEIGTFLGSGAVLLAGARKLRGSGKLHCVDPFDGSGDAVSVPHYRAHMAALAKRSLRERFEENMRDAGLTDWVEVHQGVASEIAADWATPIDLLFLDGDQSPLGARTAYSAWAPWLKPGGVIALHNSNPREYHPEHEGHRLLVLEEIRPPRYAETYLVGSTTFARKVLAA